MKKLILMVLLLLAGTVYGDEADFKYSGNGGSSRPRTPEEKAKAAEYLAKKKADREALAITLDNATFRTWHKGKDPQPAKKGGHPTHKLPTLQPIIAKATKIYPDTVVLELHDSTTVEVPRKDLIRVDRELIDKLASKNAK